MSLTIPNKPAGSEGGEIEALAHAARELAEYASYAEIIGSIGHNRKPIREWCDKTFEALRAYEASAYRAMIEAAPAVPASPISTGSEKDQGASPSGSGSRPSDRTPSGFAPAGVDPSRDTAAFDAAQCWKLSEETRAYLREIDLATVRPGDPRMNSVVGPAGPAIGLDGYGSQARPMAPAPVDRSPQGRDACGSVGDESAVTGAAGQAPVSDQPVPSPTDAKTGEA